MRNPHLVPERRTDKRGVAVTRWVRPEKARATNAIPAPSAPPRQEPFTPGPNETTPTNHIFAIGEGRGPITVPPPSPELQGIPHPPDPALESRARKGYWFNASYAEVYDVLSAVRPEDALDLLQRGIRTAEDARCFLDEHGLTHLGWEAKALTEEMMRRSVPPKWVMHEMAAVVGYEPSGAVEYILALRKRPEVAAIRDLVVSGKVTVEDLEEVEIGAAPYAVVPAVARAIVASKAEGREDYSLPQIHDVVSSYTTFEMTSQYSVEALEAALSVLRFHGFTAAEEMLDYHAYVRARSHLTGELTEQQERRLAGIAVYSSELDGMVTTDEDADAVIDAYDRGVGLEALNEHLAGTDEHEPLSLRVPPFTEGVATAVSDGWL